MSNVVLFQMCLELWAGVINLLSIVVIGRIVYRHGKTLRHIWRLLAATNVLLISDVSSNVLRGTSVYTGEVFLKISTFMVSFLHCLIIWAFVLFINKLIYGQDRPCYDKYTGTVAVSMIICLAILLSNHWTHISYFIDENNQYIESSTSFLSFLMPLFSMIVCIIYIAKNRKSFGERMTRTLLLALFIIVVCIIIQFQVGGFAMLNLAISMDILIIMIEYYVSIYEINIKERLEQINEAKKNYGE